VRGKHAHQGFEGGVCFALGDWLGQVRLTINALLVKKGVGWDR